MGENPGLTMSSRGRPRDDKVSVYLLKGPNIFQTLVSKGMDDANSFVLIYCRSNQWADSIRKKEIGSPARARTRDPLINSQLLYQLSYRGIEVAYTN